MFALADAERILTPEKWSPAQIPAYHGVHGMVIPEGEKKYPKGSVTSSKMTISTQDFALPFRRDAYHMLYSGH